jgi:type II secretory pathway pseudopilin PulG
MMELLVAMGILTIALASVISIFARGSQFGLKAQERMEAARVAQAVFDLADTGVAGAAWGRRADGNIADATIASLSASVPTGLFKSHLTLVWEGDIQPCIQGGIGMHLLEITVRFDSNDNEAFDELPITPEASQPDRLIGRYYAILADRQVAP